MIPVNELKKLGHDAKLNEGKAEIVVFSKPMPGDAEIAKSAQIDGAKVVVDYCDDHFDHPIYGPIYRSMAEIADAIVCPTKMMSFVILKNTGKDSVVIADPYENERIAPHAEGNKLLWFGHHKNIEEINPYLKYHPIRLCTGESWSLESEKAELLSANITVLPMSGEYKSANRLIKSIQAGCFPVVGKTPANSEFKRFCWVGHVDTGIRWAKSFKRDLNALVTEGQAYIARYSPEAIGGQWDAFLRHL
jgi:hypothetical protein